MNTAHASPAQPSGLLDRLIVGMNAMGSVWILLLILLVTTDALSRSFLARPIAGVSELVQLSIIGIVFLQLADAIRTGRLTRSDSFLSLVQRRWPRAAHAMEALFFLLGAVYMGLGLWGSTSLLKEAYERKAFLGNEGVFTVIVWPVKAIIVLGLLVCLVQFARQCLRAFRLATTRSPSCRHPIP